MFNEAEENLHEWKQLHKQYAELVRVNSIVIICYVILYYIICYGELFKTNILFIGLISF